MAKPSFMTKPNRRRSNSNAAASPPATEAKNTEKVEASDASKVQRRSPKLPANRSNRRSRGLPLSRPKVKEAADTDSAASDSPNSEGRTGTTSKIQAPDDSTVETASPKPSPREPKLAGNGVRGDNDKPDDADSTTEESTGGDEPPPVKNAKIEALPPSAPKSIHLSIPQTLVAVGKDGRDFSVKVTVESQAYVNQSQSMASLSRKRDSLSSENGGDLPAAGLPVTAVPFLGHDGNLFHCHVCHGFGDVVCCDGCPHVYHPKCIPEDDPSRISLENDNEPWFCPICYDDQSPDMAQSAASPSISAARSSNDKRAPKRRCCECHESGGPNPLERCEGCGTHLHFPACKATGEAPAPSGDVVYCSTCRSERALEQEEEESERRSKKRKKMKTEEDGDTTGDDSSLAAGESRRRRRKSRGMSMEETTDDENSLGDASRELSPMNSKDYDEDDLQSDGDESGVENERRPNLMGSTGTPKPNNKKKKSNKKKKKKKKKASESADANEEPEPSEDLAPYQPLGPMPGMAMATPAFYFFLGENRFKVERVLARKHRYFNRLPKGVERNELVAKEGALWWMKLRPADVRRYMNMSMRDFEQRIIEWKEEKNLRDMLVETDVDDAGVTGGDPKDLSPDDEMLTYRNHERLYLGTTVGSKPFKPEEGESHNRVLLELLQDMRFHPVPMFSGNRTEEEYGQMDFSRITIPYFDVHGPISTSVGDECLGCTRGWTHYCTVLRRRVPAVEHRARLQPPLSSLMATRVGLGLRPRPMPEAKEGETEEEGKKVPVFTEREMPEATAAKNLPIVPWDSLTNPSERADDIVSFIEEAVAMKVPEPPRPSLPVMDQDSSKKTLLTRGALPIRGRKRSIDFLDRTESVEDSDVVNKCGRCRTVIQTDTGCIQCRRAQLVINMSKKVPKDGPSNPSSKGLPSKAEAKGPKMMKVQTYMLGRVTMKEGSGEMQADGDQAVANGILRQRWTPCAVLPPHTLEAPTPKPKVERSDGVDSEDSSEIEGGSFPSGDNEGDEVSKQSDKDDDMSNDDIESQDGKTRLSSTRLRSTRVSSATPEPMDDADRQKMAERQKEEENELQKKCLSVACCGILLALMRRDPLLLFASPVTAEGYNQIIKNPIDFGKIRKQVLDGKYSTLGSFVADCRLLCTNASAYNPPGSIYWKTAKELYDILAVMQKRASNWMGAIKKAHAFAWRRASHTFGESNGDTKDDDDNSIDFYVEDPFESLRKKWPEAVEMLENSDWLRKCISSDFMRTKENETAYYGSLAVRRAAIAAEGSLAPYPDTGGVFTTVSRRSHAEDENLRRLIDERVSDTIDPVELKDLPTWREESIVRVMRRTQSRRLEGRIGSINGCARCDGMRIDQELKMAMTAEAVRWGRSRRKGDEAPRVHHSRIDLSTGLASLNTREKVEKQRAAIIASKKDKDKNAKYESAVDVAVSVRGSRVHGWGLFADQQFKKGDVVAEYLGEYVSLAVTEAREKIYQEQRIQDYQFRLDDSLLIDATMSGGHGRYINHNCNPNCVAKTIPGKEPNEQLKRVIIIAQREIKPREELTYDYQFPLELDLDARIPCNCQSEQCRGFMNWDLPEKGSNNRVLRSHKRGANMRDRIRRLGRPLKSDNKD